MLLKEIVLKIFLRLWIDREDAYCRAQNVSNRQFWKQMKRPLSLF